MGKAARERRVLLDEETLARLDQAWAVRTALRPPEIGLGTLSRTGVVSVTGAFCAVGCAHCGGHYLGGMLAPPEALRVAETGRMRSWLVSGGCEMDGRVPLLAQRDVLRRLARSARLNLHPGLVRSAAEAADLARLAGVISLDFTVDEAAIGETYGFRGITGRDFIRAFELLSAEAVVFPHVLIGLRGGHVDGEGETLRTLARLGAPGVVLLVLIPTVGTGYAEVSPPPLAGVARTMAEARLLFPDRPVYLGCMRPKGWYREALDLLAVRAGVDRIAVPTPAARREAERLGLTPVAFEECCVF